MNQVDGFCDKDGVPSLLLATLHMDQAVDVFRRHLSQPFSSPSEEDPDWEAWHIAEKACRERCETAIQEWMISKSFPILDDDEAFFLCHRFYYVSQFLQSLFLRDQTSVFSHVGFSLDDVLWWAMTEWWDIHGLWDAFADDFKQQEDDVNEEKKA